MSFSNWQRGKRNTNKDTEELNNTILNLCDIYRYYTQQLLNTQFFHVEIAKSWNTLRNDSSNKFQTFWIIKTTEYILTIPLLKYRYKNNKIVRNSPNTWILSNTLKQSMYWGIKIEIWKYFNLNNTRNSPYQNLRKSGKRSTLRNFLRM